MNWKRLVYAQCWGLQCLVQPLVVQRVGEQPQGITVKAESVTMPNFSNAPIADIYAIFDIKLWSSVSDC